MDQEPAEAIRQIDELARNQLWSGRDNPKRGKGKYEVSEITDIQAEMAQVRAELAKLGTALGTHQKPSECGACGDEGHTSAQCPLAQPDQEPNQVNSINNHTSYFPKPPFSRSYSENEGERKDWHTMNNPDYKANFQRKPFRPNGQDQTGSNQNYYRNAHFDNNQGGSNNRPRNYPACDDQIAWLQNFAHEQGKMNGIIFESLAEMDKNLGAVERLEKMMEAHLASNAPRQPGHFSSQPEPNLKADCKAMTLRSGSNYKGLTIQPEQTKPPVTRSTWDTQVESRFEVGESSTKNSRDEQEEAVLPQSTPSNLDKKASQPKCPEQQESTTEQAPPTRAAQGKKKVDSEPSKYAPLAPYPHRLLRYRVDQEFKKFVNMLKQLKVTIPFTQVIAQVPKYAKFLKDVICNKRLLGGDYGPVKLTEQCSAVLTRAPSKAIPPKLDDPGKFTVPCTIGKATIKRALCDL